MTRFSLLRLALPLLLCLGLVACAGNTRERDETAGWTVERLYREAKEEQSVRNWTRAAELLEKLESRFPFGTYAQQAQMELAYVRWKEGELALALAAADRFIRLHPNHPAMDYMLYLKGLINFYRDVTLFSRFTEQDPSERDQRAARDSFAAFQELTTRFPDSAYTPDAIERMTYLVNALAQNEVHIARFYLERGAYLAAANRAQVAVRDFQGAPAVEEALFIMIKAYEALGMNDLRDAAQRVLDKNYPNSRFPREGFVDQRSSGPWWRFW